MNRKDFLLNGLIIGGASMLPSNSVFANSLEAGMDKLTDANGNFIHLPLPYNNNFLEPHMDEETVHIHYTFHHEGAVKAANKDLIMIKEAMSKETIEMADYWTKKLSFHFSSHILHTIFWTNLTNKAQQPKGELLKRIEKDFGSFEKLKQLIAGISKTVDGNGWGILAYQPYSDKLTVLQCENHEKLTQWGAIPLLVIDVWEHAYYLKHKNKRDQFVDTLFNIINWDNVSHRFELALKIK
jgi:superoxide dismutase, Fe-Mn family